MNQKFLALDLAHEEDGQVRGIQISYKTVAYLTVGLIGFSILLLAGGSSYLLMKRQVSNYNQVRADLDALRMRYQDLERVSTQHTDQIASLETLANEVSVAYGLSGPGTSEGAPSGIDNDPLTPNVKESIEEYNFLKGASYAAIYHQYAHQWQTHARPSIWPVDGPVRSAFGSRSDPFSGEGAFHTGIDVAAAHGTPVHVTADGVVTTQGWSGGYGKLLIVDHGNGLETYYAHLSQFLVVPGQEVTRGQVIALSGGTGRSTGPHVHYEVRLHGTPLNPYRFLPRMQLAHAASTPVHSDLGL